jgi:hypothetical protein
LERFAPWLFEKVPDDELRAHTVEQPSPRSQHEGRMHRGTVNFQGRMLSEARRMNGVSTDNRNANPEFDEVRIPLQGALQDLRLGDAMRLGHDLQTSGSWRNTAHRSPA